MSKILTLIGNNLELLKSYADNSFDSIVTDAPYGLGKEPNAIKLLQDWIDHGYHEIKGKGFMGKEWDAFVPQPLFWKEVFRVLKPGGYVLCFFGTRTYDWGTLAIRLAGFKIRDMITWNYGSGFPKSLDVSKAIDKSFGIDREDKWEGLGRNIGPSGNIRCEKCDKWYGSSNPCKCERPQDNAITDEAKKYEGFGTALKPALEPICVARKPIEGTVAENYLKWGTGGVNIDGCRIETDEVITNHSRGNESAKSKGKYGDSSEQETHQTSGQQKGRFPANVIFDEFTADILDKQTGILKSGAMTKSYEYQNNGYSLGKPTGATKSIHEANEGGASRFFYCAKASKSERNAGCEHIPTTTTTDGRKKSIDNSFQRGETERNNNHPTVKPIALMRYLIRLVTPKDGKCLDPFAGSGTTGCASAFEDVGEMVLMEREAEYIPIIEARVSYWQRVALQEKEDLSKSLEKELQAKNQLELF